MYAVVEYSDSRKENYFRVITTTDWLDYAKKLAFKHAKDYLIHENNFKTTDYQVNFKITSEIQHQYVYPNNNIIVEYRVVGIENNYHDELELTFATGPTYAVIELEDHNKKNYLEEIDENLIYKP